MNLERTEIKKVLEIMTKESVRLDRRMKSMAKESVTSYDDYTDTVDNLNYIKKLIEKIKKEYTI